MRSDHPRLTQIVFAVILVAFVVIVVRVLTR
jgi:hypothetical protein